MTSDPRTPPSPGSPSAPSPEDDRYRLSALAAGFAGRLTDLLRRTVNEDADIQARLVEGEPRALVGAGVAGSGEGSIKPGTVTVRVGETGEAHLLVSYGCTFDLEGRYLAVETSQVGLFLLPYRSEPLFRYEFDRDKRSYTPAHLHVHGHSNALGRLFALAGKDKAVDLSKLHLPVGGKRFRPTLEDVLECLFAEGLLQPLPGWQDAIDEHRRDYYVRQLKAAIRRDEAVAVEQLRSVGYQIVEPPDS